MFFRDLILLLALAVAAAGIAPGDSFANAATTAIRLELQAGQESWGPLRQDAEYQNSQSAVAVTGGNLTPQKYSLLLPELRGSGLSLRYAVPEVSVRSVLLSQGNETNRDRFAGMAEVPFFGGQGAFSVGTALGRNSLPADDREEQAGILLLKGKVRAQYCTVETEAGFSSYSPAAGTSSDDAALRTTISTGFHSVKSDLSYQRIGPRYGFFQSAIAPRDREEVLLATSWNPTNLHTIETRLAEWKTNVERNRSYAGREGRSLDLMYKLGVIKWLPVRLAYRQAIEQENRFSAGKGAPFRSQSGRSTVSILSSLLDLELDAGATFLEDADKGDDIRRTMFLALSPRMRMKDMRFEPTLRLERGLQVPTKELNDRLSMKLLVAKPLLPGATMEVEGRYLLSTRNGISDSEVYGAGMCVNVPLKKVWRRGVPGKFTLKTDYRKQVTPIIDDSGTFSVLLGLESG